MLQPAQAKGRSARGRIPPLCRPERSQDLVSGRSKGATLAESLFLKGKLPALNCPVPQLINCLEMWRHCGLLLTPWPDFVGPRLKAGGTHCEFGGRRHLRTVHLSQNTILATYQCINPPHCYQALPNA